MATGAATDPLRARLAEVEDLQAALRVLQFDQQTTMPPGGGPARAEALTTLAGVLHERRTDPALAELLGAADPADPLVRVARRDAEKARRVPAGLVAALTRAAAEGEQAWELARQAGDFAAFRPYLERNVELAREYAACFADEVDEPYDALLDDYEPGMRTGEVRAAFSALRDELPGLVGEAAGAAPPRLDGPFPIEGQRRAVRAVLERVGFDPRTWVLAESAHPFSSTAGRDDNRITTRYDPSSLESLTGALHEFGHGLYEAQIDPALARTPLGHGCSMAVHESQSRLWELFVAGRAPFWRGAWPLLADALGEAVEGLGPEDLVAAWGAVRPSLIRVESDPVSYPLHIVLRFDLELALVSGDLAVADLPAAWNDGMRDLLGVDVPDDRRGVLQDVHWSSCAFGYFPTYALGTVLAAQLWAAADADLGGLDAAVEAGDLAPLRDWLRERVHRHGRTHEPRDLVRLALGGDLDAGPYLAFARERVALTASTVRRDSVRGVRTAVLTISTTVSRREAEDASGPALARLAEEAGADVQAMEVVPDDLPLIEDRLHHYVDEDMRLILTTGGTGLTPDDVTPEATRRVIQREAPGIAEALRAASAQHTPMAMLSRGVAGIRDRTLIVNLPGNPRAVEQAFGVLAPVLRHAADTLEGRSHR